MIEVIQVYPHDDYIVDVLFSDGKMVRYNARHLTEEGKFPILKDINFYEERCTVMNHTLAWDVSGKHDPAQCIDIDPDVLYS